MRKTEKGDNSVMDLENDFYKGKSGHLHHRHNLRSKYHDHSSSGSRDIHKLTLSSSIMRKKVKGENSGIDLENFTKS